MKGSNWRDSRITCELFCVLADAAENDFLGDPKKVKVLDTFKVRSYNEAIEYTKQYRKEHKSDGWKYYWRIQHSSDFSDFGLWHCDGICSYGASDVDCVFIDWIARTRVKMRKDKDYTNHKHYIKKIARIRKLSSCKVIRGLLWTWLKFWDGLTCYCWVRPKNKFKNWRWNKRNLKNWKKTGHSLDEYWSLEMHMLKDLKYNLKKLNENGYGINTTFMYDALRDKYSLESAEEIEKRMEKIMTNSNRVEAEEIEQLAVEHQRQTYDHIAHLVDLYTFYINQEIDDKEPTKENMTDDMHLYLVEGTYNMLDYKKMLDEGQKVWNEIWDLVKKYGQQMGD